MKRGRKDGGEGHLRLISIISTLSTPDIAFLHQFSWCPLGQASPTERALESASFCPHSPPYTLWTAKPVLGPF
jgi:hypothetical protein